MGSGDLTVTLKGGAPWGFRLEGGGDKPLHVSKIRKKSQAHVQGLREGDSILTLNGTAVAGKSFDQAMALLDQAQDSLTMQVSRRTRDASKQEQQKVSGAPTTMTSSPQVTVAAQVRVERAEGKENVPPAPPSNTSTSMSITKVPTFHVRDVTKIEEEVSKEQPFTPDTWLQSAEKRRTQEQKKQQQQQNYLLQEKQQYQLRQQQHQFEQWQRQQQDNARKLQQQQQRQQQQQEPRRHSFQQQTQFQQQQQYNQQYSPQQQFNMSQSYTQGQSFNQNQSYNSLPRPWSGSQQQLSQVRQVQSFGSQGQFSPGGGGTPMWSSTSSFSPGSVSPGSQMSPGGIYRGPQFHVRQVGAVGKGPGVWTPNVWAPGQEPERRPRANSDSQHGMSRQMSTASHSEWEEDHMSSSYHHDDDPHRFSRPPIFAPPVEQHLEDPSECYPESYFPPSLGPHKPTSLEFTRTDSIGSDLSSPTSSAIERRKKKLFSDSAFYDDPSKKYPTIEDQMKLCQQIAHSLTANENKKARGARMFAKRKNRANKWVHTGDVAVSSSAGDVADLHELDSELYDHEGGNKALFSFRIPKVKHRVADDSEAGKMALSQAEFERLRLDQKSKCDHRNVAPNTCFEIASGLKASKGKAGRMFEKRRQRSEKYVVDETNARKPPERATRLDSMLGTKPIKSPWQAALEDQGRVDQAFSHVDQAAQMKKLSQQYETLKRSQEPWRPPPPPPEDAPPVKVTHHNLAADASPLSLLQGKDFNRKARGWNVDAANAALQSAHYTNIKAPVSPAPLTPQYGGVFQAPTPRDHNPRPKAWRGPGDTTDFPEERWPGMAFGSRSPQPPAPRQQHAPPPAAQNSWGHHAPQPEYGGGYRPSPSGYHTLPRAAAAGGGGSSAVLPGTDL